MGTIEFLYDYPPVSLAKELTPEQRESRQKILMFLNGDCSQEIKNALIERILNLVKLDSEDEWAIGFIPAPDASNTIMRYGELALELGKHTDYRVYLDLFESINIQDDLSYTVNRERILGCNVILVDSVFTSGQRYHIFEKKIIEAGAKTVYGIIVAKAKNH